MDEIEIHKVSIPPTESPGSPSFKTSWTLQDIAPALVEAQKDFKSATKDATGQIQSRTYGYSTLESVWKAVQTSLATHGLCVIQGQSQQGADLTVSSRLLHSSGEWIEVSLTCSVPDMDPQTLGKVHTYLRRYTLQGLLMIPTEDQDAAGVGKRVTYTVADSDPRRTENSASEPRELPGVPERQPSGRYAVPTEKRTVPVPNGATGRVPTVRFGKDTGAPVSEVPVADLEWYTWALMSNIDNPQKANWRDDNLASFRELWGWMVASLKANPELGQILDKHGEAALKYDEGV